MSALDLLISGLFDEAIEAYRQELQNNPNDIGSLSGLAIAYMSAGRYQEAVPLGARLHDVEKAENPDSPGQWLQLSCAYWCLEQRTRAIEFARNLCAGILDQSISMAPDLAGGATYGLILHYMAITEDDEPSIDFALKYLRKLNAKYDKRPKSFHFPVQTVKQVLGELEFEEVLIAATKERTLDEAYRAASHSRSIKLALGVALFHDGVLRRAAGDESGFLERMKQVLDLGYQTESIRWQLARHEVTVMH